MHSLWDSKCLVWPGNRRSHVAQARSGSGPWARFFARLSAAGLPRGGGDGDAIRMGILHIMRENGIREGHRPVRPVLNQ